MIPTTCKSDLSNVSPNDGGTALKRLADYDRLLTILKDLSDLLSKPLCLGELLEEALAYVCSYTPFDAGRIYLMTRERNAIQLVAYLGMDVAGLERVSLHEGFTGRCARTRSFIALPVDSLADRQRVGLLTAKGLAMIVCVPFVVQERVEGVMNLATREVIVPDQVLVNLLMVMGHLIGAAAIRLRKEEEFETTIQALKRQKETIEIFLSTIIHDLKSPAVGAHGLLRRLSDSCRDTFGQREKTYCEQILKATAQIVTLVDDLNALIRTRELPMSSQVVSIKGLWEALHREFQEELERREITWVEQEGPPEVTANEIMLLRAFRNLVQNALKHGGHKLTTVRLGWQVTTTHYIFFVRDDGRGIPAEDQRMLFQPFHRLAVSKAVEGSGLGLTIVREVAGRHDGEAWVRSSPGRGSVLFFSIRKLLSK